MRLLTSEGQFTVCWASMEGSRMQSAWPLPAC